MDSTFPHRLQQGNSRHQPADGDADDLAAARLFRAAAIAARTAGSIDIPLKLLTDAELNAPIVDGDGDAWERKPLRIRGYQIEAETGSGGQATVYAGLQDSTRRKVAIKVMAGGPFLSSKRRERFDREAKLLAGFDSPNIVGILDRGRTDDGSFFIVMDFIEGMPLDQYWPQLTGEPRKLAGLFVKIARAVEDAHQKGIVHRDLKPSNIRIDRRGEPYVLDFGLARLTRLIPGESIHQSITHSGQMLGSLPWSSPEQAGTEDEDVDFRSDVYSLGIMLYQAIGGKFPYKIDGSLGETLKNIATSVPIAPSKLIPGISRENYAALDGITLKSLAKNPEDRYSSAGGLADDLENYLEGRSTSKPTRKQSSRSRWIVYTALCLVIAGAGWAGLKTIRGGPPPVVMAQLPVLKVRLGITFVRIPIGTTLLGSSTTERGRAADETLHNAKIDKFFWISTEVITQQQFAAVMGFNPSDPRFSGPTFPVQCVTWNEATEFCRKFSSSTQYSCRLPTETEWEYACRASEFTPFGDGRTMNDVGWWAGNSGNTLHPVATKPPNFWGLYDMHGNVSEWCLDLYQSYPLKNHLLSVDALAPGDRVVRGGGFLSAEASCRAAARSKMPPDTRKPDLGFRVVIDGPAVPLSSIR